MPRPARRLPAFAVLAAACFATVGETRAQDLDENFVGNAPDPARWTSRVTAGSSGVVSVADGKLTLGSGVTSSSQRATLVSNTSGLDPFHRPLEIVFDGLTLGGSPSIDQPVAGNTFYAALGRASADAGSLDSVVAAHYSAVGGDYAGALGLNIRRSASAFVLSVIDRGSGNHSSADHALDGAPTALTWTIDGTGTAPFTWSVTISGASFTEGHATRREGSFSRFAADSLAVGGARVARLAFGAINSGAVAAPTLVTLDRVALSGPAEPPTLPPRRELPWTVGVNLASAAFGGVYPGVLGTHYGWPQADDLDYHKARGMELIRLPFRWERVQQTLYGPLDPAELGRLDAFLDLAEQRGMLVIPDLHNFGRYTINGTQHIVGSPEVPRSAFADVWNRLTAHLKHRDCIWAWGIMNEPYAMGSHTWKTTAQLGINAVRAHDLTRPILIGGDGYSGAHSWLKYSADLHELVDPANDLIFEAHQYFDSDHSGRYVGSYDAEGAYPDAGIDRLAPFVGWLRQHGLRGFIGEYGVPDDDPRWLVVLDRTLAYMKANNLPGTYWAAGPRWGSYKLRSNIRPAHDESPQMRAMLPHVTGPGTRYWPPFTWYHDSVSKGLSTSYSYHYKSETAALAANFADPASSATGSYNGAAGIRLDYAVPPGGWAGGGLHIEGGVNLAASFAAGHVLAFSAKGGAGASVRVFFTTTDGVNSLKVNTAAHVALTDAWQRVRIPLADFVHAGFDGSARVHRIAFECLPLDNVARTVQLDAFVIERPETVAPSLAFSLADDATEVAAGAPVTLLASAEDPSGIDYVEFLVDGFRHGIATTAPYSQTLTLPAAGSYRLVAIAHDLQGNPARTASRTLTVTSAPATFADWQRLHFSDAERADPALEASRWGAAADPDGDGHANLLEYAFATSPLEADAALAPVTLHRVDDGLVARYRRAKRLDSDATVTLALETSPDLATASPWSPLADDETIHADLGDHELREVPLPAGLPRRFVRLSATRLP